MDLNVKVQVKLQVQVNIKVKVHIKVNPIPSEAHPEARMMENHSLAIHHKQ